MPSSTGNLWPFSTRAAIVLVPVIFLGLILVTVLTRTFISWPSDAAERFVLIGIFAGSLVPLLLVLTDTLTQQGAVIEYKGVKLAFARMSQARSSAMPVPANIGVPGQPVSDSSSAMILEALRKAIRNEVVILDLEEGQASNAGGWWETRLLVLLSGAVRLGRPRAVAFLATEGGKTEKFQGWGYTDDLLNALLQTDPRYRKCYYAAKAASSQWALIEPPLPGVAQSLPAFLTGLAQRYSWMAIDQNTQLPNELGPEQLLASELGSSIESVEQPRTISVVRLKDLFAPVLKTNFVDQRSSPEEQLREFTADDADYVPITQDGRYVQLVRRVAVLAAMVQALSEKDRETKPEMS